jgi:hypothetical protein
MRFTCVPDCHLWVEAANSVSICLGQLCVDTLFDHEVLNKTSWATESTRQIGIRSSHCSHTGSLLLLSDKQSLSILGGGKVSSFGLDSDLICVGIGCLLLTVKSCISISQLVQWQSKRDDCSVESRNNVREKMGEPQNTPALERACSS